MLHQLINHSSDLKRLADEGYALEIKGGYLLIHQIPYLNAKGELLFGTLITDLTLSGDRTAKPSYHVIHFMGEYPCTKEGQLITSIQHATLNQALFPDVTLNYSFSNKPPNGYTDYYHKISRYADIISAPAKSRYDNVTEKTFKVIATEADESTFQYVDTNTSRANIYPINAKLAGQKIAIIGLGGTGAYILDALAKTPVQEIHLFDGDVLQTHNAFRSPGAASINQLNQQPMKVDYYTAIYSNMHKRIIPHPYYITDENVHELGEMGFAFVSVDNNNARISIADYLRKEQRSFIDVGLGVNISGDGLVGQIRVTSSTKAKYDHLQLRLPAGEQGDNEYASNIQIAELNMLNAVLAVIKWKKLCGFYQDSEREYHSVYSVNLAELFNEDQDLAA
ncbi:ThiF family adenylyltransferase [Spirosoma gilvum]